MQSYKVDKITNAYQLLNSQLVIALIVLGFTQYKSMALLTALPTSTLINSWVCFTIYMYIGWWAIVGVSFVVIGVCFVIHQLYKWCFRDSRRQRNELRSYELVERLR